MQRWIILFLSIWVIVSSFLFFARFEVILNNLISAAVLAYFSYKITNFKKWAFLVLAVFLILFPFLPSLTKIVSQVNDAKVSFSSSHIYIRNLIVGILMTIIVYIPEKITT